MELQSAEDVQIFKDIAAFKTDVECIQIVSPLFSFESRNKFSSYQSKEDITLYSNFRVPKLDEVRKSLEQVDSVSDQMVSLYNGLKITDLDIRLRFYTAKQMSYYLSMLFPNVQVVPFGSSVNGFGQIGCDLDLLCKTIMDHRKVLNDSKRFFSIARKIPLIERDEQKEFLEVVATIMKMCIPGISNIKKILEARVPIIRFSNVYTNMICDLSSTNTVALHMSELLYIYGQLDWRIKPLIFTIRKWARDMNLTKIFPGQWITNFSLTLLIIFYLQTKNILPSISTLNKFIELDKKTKKATNSNFNWFVSWQGSIKHVNDESLLSLLYHFFEYYSTFDFKTQAICIKDGKFKPKNDFSPLYIHNPFDTTLNVSKNVNSTELIRLIDHFQKAFNIMLNSAEKDIILKLINLTPNQTTTDYKFNDEETQMRLKQNLFPTITNINNLNKIQGIIIK
ncbi:poly(A) RNA polymerase, mitochondrial isoform X3 [Bombus terrestris]|nr:poly(A) RNA polymerase, mitochondrial isoform X3 [Bombus terrestris]XP_020722086.1 poly(A) RNA polymerase, mitochondrial isoform X3 [Bombus terrestris]